MSVPPRQIVAAEHSTHPTVSEVPPGARARRRRLGVTATVLVLIIVGGLFAVGWYYTDQVLLVEEPGPPVYDTAILAVEGHEVVLDARGGASQPGTWGLRWDGGWAQVGEVISADAEGVRRPWRPLPDTPPEGAEALLDGYVWPDDATVLDPSITEIVIDGPLGGYPAWLAPGSSDTWIIAVHGRGARRSESFRLMDSVAALDVPVLAVTYRNDVGAPPAPDGRYRLGATEWEDVAAAVEWAGTQGAQRIVLAGFSMGGAISGAYLDHADPEHPRIVGVILDAPVLRWGPVLRRAAEDRGVPAWLVTPAQIVTSLRTGLRWSDVDWMARAEELEVPILLIHGTADATVPVATSDDLAAARSDLVTYLRVPGAGHVSSWNADPEAYASAVADFLGPLLR